MVIFLLEEAIFPSLKHFSLWFIILLCHALIEPGKRKRKIKETKRLFARALTNSHCLFCYCKIIDFCVVFMSQL